MLIKIFFGLVEITFGLVRASYSLPEWQGVKLTFIAPCSGLHVWVYGGCNPSGSMLKKFVGSSFNGILFIPLYAIN